MKKNFSQNSKNSAKHTSPKSKGTFSSSKSYEKKEFGNKDYEKKSYEKSSYAKKDEFAKKPFGAKSYDKKEFGNKDYEKKSYEKSSYAKKDEFAKKPFGAKSYDKKEFGNKDYEKKSYEKSSYAKKDEFAKKPFGAKSYDKKEFGNKDYEKKSYEKSSYAKKDEFAKKPFGAKSYDKKEFGNKDYEKSNFADKKKPFGQDKKVAKAPFYDLSKYKNVISRKKAEKESPAGEVKNQEMRLNRFLANAGICSRREADELIKQGFVKVNGKVITEMGFKVSKKDEITYKGEQLSREKLVYVLLNKPKNYITTMDDPEERRTVMSLVENACEERIYPVGRLDRNTTGLLLFTNDGLLAEKLTHPSHKVKKIYEVTLDRSLTEEDFVKLQRGIELEDGLVQIDKLALLDHNKVGLEIHIGKNRIVRRIFEALGYEVEKLDRTVYASLTKKDLPRGHWRFLNEKEVVMLKYML
jgi:23S rRNA pseudouridine2605 synthase